jgi:hypothetical protein
MVLNFSEQWEGRSKGAKNKGRTKQSCCTGLYHTDTESPAATGEGQWLLSEQETEKCQRFKQISAEYLVCHQWRWIPNFLIYKTAPSAAETEGAPPEQGNATCLSGITWVYGLQKFPTSRF